MTHPRPTRFRNPQSAIRNRSAFSLVELLVAIAIVAVLAGLTIKGVSKFRKAAWATDTTNELMTIQNAIQNYHSTFNALPGPIPNRSVGTTTVNAALGINSPNLFIAASNSVQFDDSSPSGDLIGVTGTENLVLGLYGGLYVIPGNEIAYDPGRIGQGPSGLNPLSPKKYGAFLENQNLLSWRTITGNKKTGYYKDDVAAANDTLVPELVDRFPQGMPILYLRADKGAAWNSGLAATPTNQINNVITDDSNGTPTSNIAQYHLNHIKGYTATTPAIGESKSGGTTHGLKAVTLNATLTGNGPYDAYPYLTNPAVSTANTIAHAGDVARKKDDYILISPGIDRIYGTKDDITSFGSVLGD